MNRKVFLKIAALLLLPAILQSCMPSESEWTVRRKCRKHLQEKYDTDFKVESFNQFFHGGLWAYSTTLFMYPADNKSIIFSVSYDEDQKKVRSDEYKTVLWADQFQEDIKPLLNQCFHEYKIRTYFRKDADSFIYSSDLPFYPDYSEMIKQINQPGLEFELYIAGDDQDIDSILDGILGVSRFVADIGLTKSMYEIYFVRDAYFSEGKKLLEEKAFDEYESLFIKELLFKFTDENILPGKGELYSLLSDYEDYSLYSKNKDIFEEAGRLMENGRDDEAISLYLQIIESVSPYRFRHHVPSQTAYSVHSAYALGEYYENKGDTEEADRYYRYIVDSLKYENALLENYDHYITALQKINGDDEQNIHQ